MGNGSKIIHDSAYHVHSIPLALFARLKVLRLDLRPSGGIQCHSIRGVSLVISVPNIDLADEA